MNPLKLEDIIPQASEFTLSATGKTYRLRPISLDDEVWLKQTFGESIKEVFEEVKMFEVCRIVFHQMEPESQKDFIKQNVKIVNEEGDSETLNIGGYKLLFSMVAGTREKMDMFKALLQTIGISRPILDKIGKVELEKKNEELNQLMSKPTGLKSSTTSQPLTDGPQTRSEN